jgi:hypothetical protein
VPRGSNCGVDRTDAQSLLPGTDGRLLARSGRQPRCQVQLSAPPLALPEDGLDVAAVWIQNERREVAKRIVAGAEPRATIILAARRNRNAVKVLDHAAAARSKGGALLRSMWVKHIDPENRAAHPIADSAKFRIVATTCHREGLGDARYRLKP